jgi:UDP-N-acetyl-D-mannosaminuronic acid dehydrogenase
VGGHCIPIDPWFLVGDFPLLTDLIRAAREVNDSMPDHVLVRASEIMLTLGLTDFGKAGIYGLTYKEDVDDIRDSPSLQLLSSMQKHMAKAPKVYDPYVKEKITQNQCFSLDAFLEGLEMVIIMTAHREILEHKAKLNNLVVLDTRAVCNIAGAYRL